LGNTDALANGWYGAMHINGKTALDLISENEKL
jgi:hypothetical protein